MKKTYKISLDADTRNLKVIADFIEGKLKGKTPVPVVMDEVLVAVDEAVTNIIKHSYKNKDGHIRMILKLMKEKIVISIFDNGSVFEPDKIPLPDFSEKLNKRSAGGLGLFLMKQFMDEVNFYFKGASGRNENEVRMVKYIK